MGYQEIPPGAGISAHRHVGADEIIFVHKGRGSVELGDMRREVSEGATIYVPAGTRIAMRPGKMQPMTIIYVLSDPAYVGYMRDLSVREGDTFAPLTRQQLKAIRAKHRAHVEYE